MNMTRVIRGLLDQQLCAVGLQRRPSTLSLAGTALAVGAAGALVGAVATALLTPASGPRVRARLKQRLNGLGPVAGEPDGADRYTATEGWNRAVTEGWGHQAQAPSSGA
jgi:hypothetical protein